jgi:hypothetical protein
MPALARIGDRSIVTREAAEAWRRRITEKAEEAA